jgi:DNA-binding NarL/FixJ family response regulator
MVEPLAPLTEREKDVLNAIIELDNCKEASQKLGVAERTVKQHLGRLYLKHKIVSGNKKVQLVKMYSDIVPGTTNCRLTNKQRVILRGVADGEKNYQIAVTVGTTENTIKNMLRQIYDKTGMDSRTELALWYLSKFPEEAARVQITEEFGDTHDIVWD